jgi:hypothetical protein
MSRYGIDIEHVRVTVDGLFDKLTAGWSGQHLRARLRRSAATVRDAIRLTEHLC